MNRDLLLQMLYFLLNLEQHSQEKYWLTLSIRAELARPDPKPIAYLAWRDGKPAWGEVCVCEDDVWPADEDDDRVSMPVYLRETP